MELQTPDDYDAYRFVPANNGLINFKIRASNDAHIALTSGPAISIPMLEVFIGGWRNTKSVIRKNRERPDVSETPTPGILNAGEFRGFWIRWFNGQITVGREGEAAAFLSYEDPTPFPINFAGYATGWGATGSWIIEDAAPIAPATTPQQYGSGQGHWVLAKNGEVPPQAVQGGMDHHEPIFLARAKHEGALIPGKLVPGHGVCYVAWRGDEHPHREYEVLCGASGKWVPVSGTAIPPTAIPGGKTETGEPLFIGRANHLETITTGKVTPSHGCCHISYGGAELLFADYEVYVT